LLAWIHLVHTAFAPPYGTLLLSAQQLTADMTGFQHFTETFSNYCLCYYSILQQPYAWFSTAQTTNHYFLQLPVPNPQHGSNHCLSFSKLLYFNSDMLSVHHIVMQPKLHNSQKKIAFEQQILFSLLNSLVCWCSTVSSCSYFTEQSNMVTMATKCNSHQQYSAVFRHLYHGLSAFLYKTSEYY